MVNCDIEQPRPFEVFEHFKGNLYQVICVAEHTESGNSYVVYQALYGTHKMYVRPFGMFTETITRDGKTFKRFSKIIRNNNSVTFGEDLLSRI